MATHGGSNNKLHPPTSTNTYQRDEKYYYPDGTGVFVVDGVLFKLHASLIFASRSGYRCEVDHRALNGQPDPVFFEDVSPKIGSSSDNNPIPLPGITTRELRNYLLLVLGQLDDEEYQKVLTDAGDPRKHSPSLCAFYLDGARLAHQFGKCGLYHWAVKQLHQILTVDSIDSIYNLVLYPWSTDILLQLRSYSRSRLFMEMRTMNIILFLVSISVDETHILYSPENRDLCAQLFKVPLLPNDEPVLFGCVFVSILSLGHRSWTTDLALRHRAILYAAQAQLIRVCDVLHSLDWLLRPPSPSTLPSLGSMCYSCQLNFSRYWTTTFGTCGRLNSDVPLKDVTSLAKLAEHRNHLKDKWSEYEEQLKPARERPNSWFTKITYLCSNGGCSINDALADIDKYIWKVYEELAGQYNRISAEVDGLQNN